MGLDKDSDAEVDDAEMKSRQLLHQLRSNVTKASAEWKSTVRKRVLNFTVFLFSIPCLVVFIIGSYDFVRNVESNKCQMTYMFEFPQYVHIPLDPSISQRFPMYSLYAYAEGKHIEPARNFKFTGIPVLYLPGNAGSYKQVRSYASVALRKWLDSKTPFHFDFFTVDFNDELSALYGYVLPRQSQYLKLVLDKIISLYEDYHHVVIIGHSMGGILAKSVNEDSAKVQLIYTMATPHRYPPLIIDPELELFYYFVAHNWTKVSKMEDSSPVTLVTVAGGERDLLVAEKLTAWKHNTIQTSAPAIPTVWASTDHLCIVWCKQLVMTVIRSLFDLVEYKQTSKFYGVTDNATVRETVLKYHFLKRSSGKSFHTAHLPTLSTQSPPPPKGNWTEISKHTYCEASFRSPTWVMVPQITFTEKMYGGPSARKDYGILVSTTNTQGKDWIFGCTNLDVRQNIKYCSTLENLSNSTILLPSVHRQRKVIHLASDLISRYSHLVIKMDTAKFKTCLDIEVYSITNRSGYLGMAIKDTNHGIFYNLTYPVTLNQSKVFVWTLHVDLVKDLESQGKSSTKCPGHYNSIGIFQHGNFQTHNFFKNESLRVRFADTSVSTGYALLYLAKGCRYSIKINLDWIGTAGQFFRLGFKLLPAYFSSIVLMSLFFQQSGSQWRNFHSVLIQNAYAVAILPGFLVGICIAFLPTDYRYMLTEAEYSALLPMICYFVSYSLVLLVSFGLWLMTLTFGNGLHSIITRFVSRKLGSVPDKVTDLALSLTFDRFPFTVALFVIAIGMSTSGALGLGIGLVLHIVKIFKGYEGLLEDLVRSKISTVGEGLSPINFQVHATMLWLIVASLNVPSLLYWINNFKFAEIPNWDLSLYLCLMMAPTMAFLWQDHVPSFNPTMWWIQRYLCYFMGIVVVVYGTHRIYLISLIIVVVLVSLAICQLISNLSPVEQEEEPSVVEQSPPDSTPVTKESLVRGSKPRSNRRSRLSSSSAVHEAVPGGGGVSKENLERTDESTGSDSDSVE